MVSAARGNQGSAQAIAMQRTLTADGILVNRSQQKAPATAAAVKGA